MVKIERTFPAPASLAIEAQKQSGSYSEPDVIKQLMSDFHNKCYICEIDDLQDLEVEHRLPHKNGKCPERKFDWNNLFWACGHCNSVKNQRKYDDGIIDCCKKDPESLICFRVKNQEVRVEAKEPDDEESVRTANLVWEVFHLANTGMRTYTSDMRWKGLQAEMNVLYDNLEKIRKKPGSVVTLRKLKTLLRRESRFAAFKRCYVREHLQEFPELEAYIA